MNKEIIELIIQELQNAKEEAIAFSKYTRNEIELFILNGDKKIHEIISDAISSEIAAYKCNIKREQNSDISLIELNVEIQNNQETTNSAINVSMPKVGKQAIDVIDDGNDKISLPNMIVDKNIENAEIDTLSDIQGNILNINDKNNIEIKIHSDISNTESVDQSTSKKEATEKHKSRKFALKGSKLQAGVLYVGTIEPSEVISGVRPVIKKVEILPDVGLHVDPNDNYRVIGTPTIGGDINVLVHYSFDQGDITPVMLSYSFTEYVNHDPKTLWKNLPSNTEDPYWKPDSDKVYLATVSNKIVAASQRGRSHAHEGKFRDDDFKIDVTDSGWVIIVVADGAGSASKSRRGSQIAVSSVVLTLKELLASDGGANLENYINEWSRNKVSSENVIAKAIYPLLGVAAFKACHAIENEATNTENLAKDYSTTLLATLYKKTDIGHVFATYWVGDGGVGIFTEGKPPFLLGKVDSGDFAGQTRFLDRKVMTTDEITSRLQFHVTDEFTALVAMTDGITDPWFMTDNNLESSEYWDKLWSELQQPINSDNPDTDLLSWLDFWSPGNHDDRTIIVLR